MPYRSAAERPEPPREENGEAVFRVRYRSWPGLVFALAMGAVAIVVAGFFLVQTKNVALAAVALATPTILLGFALHVLVKSAADVDLRVRPTSDRSAFQVMLRRRWGLLGWAAPLAFSSESAPSIETHWKEGRYSSKTGIGRRYQHACLYLRVGPSKIVLPSMRGERVAARDVVVVDHAPEVKEAISAYQAELATLGAFRKRTKKSAPRDAHGPSVVASLEVANGTFAWLGMALTVIVPGLLALGAYALASSRAGFVLAAFVLPTFGGLIALVATAMAYGKTLHLQSRSTEQTAVTPVADYFLFGPVLARPERPAHVLPKSFPFRIERKLIGEEETERFVLVIVESGKVLAGAADEGEMRRYGERLGGREEARAS